MEYNLADLFESIADTVPDREALVYVDHPGTGQEQRLTYEQLERAANRLAHHLADSGMAAGDHVGLHLYNGIEYVQTLLACLKLRAVPVNVNYRYVEDELAYLYRDADLTALVFDGEFTARVAAALPRTEKLRHLLRVGPAPEGVPEPGSTPVPFKEAVAACSPARDFAPRSGGRPVHHLHRWHHGAAEGSDVAGRGPVLLRPGRRRPHGRARAPARGTGRAGGGRR